MQHARETTRPEGLGEAADLILRWPAHEPLAALVSGGGKDAHNAWTILARPSEVLVIHASTSDASARQALEEAFARVPRTDHGHANAACNVDPRRAIPFTGGWIVALGYGLGTAFEPKARCATRAANDACNGDAPPRAVLLWCEDAWCLEHATGALHAVGHPPALDDFPSVSSRAWRLDSFRAVESDARYDAQVARAIEYIRAGDAFQANIARRFEARLSGDVRAFAHAAIARNSAWFGALLELPGGESLVSMSPELFLRVDAEGQAATRPIKGTRPASTPTTELLESAKDAAELAMIVDLMRNDLGRVSEIGSVHVEVGLALETHVTVHHGVAEVRARLRDDVTWIDLLAATFPPGSVTGAPKVRAMQIIDELEDHPRGFYCGAIGYVSRSGNCALSVAIRTAEIGTASNDARPVVYHAGCGIVADSEPSAEVLESHAKARALAQLAGPEGKIGANHPATAGRAKELSEIVPTF